MSSDQDRWQVAIVHDVDEPDDVGAEARYIVDGSSIQVISVPGATIEAAVIKAVEKARKMGLRNPRPL